MKWVKVVDVEVVAAQAAAADADRVGWVALRPPGPEVTASAPTAGTGSPTWQASPATKRNAHSAARRWSASEVGK